MTPAGLAALKAAPCLDDDEYAAVCIADEAANQPYEGQAAIGEVLLHRMAARYRSDGTVRNTVLAKLQFSGFWCDMEQGHYEVVCRDLSDAAARAAELVAQFKAKPSAWAGYQAVWAAVRGGTVHGGPIYSRIAADRRAFLYVNLDAVARPAWATPQAEVGKLYAHTFFQG